jgi:hypothetical protein
VSDDQPPVAEVSITSGGHTVTVKGPETTKDLGEQAIDLWHRTRYDIRATGFAADA